MFSTYSPYDDRYIRSQQPHMEHKTLTTYPVRSVQSLYLNIPPIYITNNTDHMSTAYSPISILDSTPTYTALTTCPVHTLLSLY